MQYFPGGTVQCLNIGMSCTGTLAAGTRSAAGELQQLRRTTPPRPAAPCPPVPHEASSSALATYRPAGRPR